MRGWEIYLITYCSLILVATPIYAQNNKLDELILSLNDGKFFKSQELYHQICDTIPVPIDSYYKFRIEEFINRKDSAALVLEKTLTDYPYIFGAETVDIYSLLFNTYIKLRDYKNGEYTYNRLKEYLEVNPHDMDEEDIKSRKKNIEDGLLYLKEVVANPPITIKRKAINKSIKTGKKGMSPFKAKYNGIQQTTFFDTGVDSYIIMRKATADKIGLKITDKNTKGHINGVEMSGGIAILDSIELGNITLYNIPAIVYEFDLASTISDSIKCDKSIMKRFNSINNDMMNPIIGLPSMFLIGKIEIDWKHRKMYFPQKGINVQEKKNNLFIFGNKLFTQLHINKIPFTGFLDSGSKNYIDIDTTFYRKHQELISIDTTTINPKLNFYLAHKILIDIPYHRTQNTIVSFNQKIIPKTDKNDNVLIYPMNSTHLFFDGVIGYGFFKRIGKKVLLDLDNMRLEAVE